MGKYTKKKKRNPLLIPVIVLSVAVVVLAALLILQIIAPWEEMPPVTEPTGITGQTEVTSQTEVAGQAESTVQTDVPDQTQAQTDAPGQTETPKQTEQPETTAPKQPVIKPPQETEAPVADIVVETPFVTLYLPGQWEDDLRYECKGLSFGMDVEVYGTVAGKEYWLYTVHLGGADGIPVGVITTEDGYMLDVTYEMSDYVPGDDWSAQDVDLFSAMQESVNHMVQKLQEDPSFEG